MASLGERCNAAGLTEQNILTKIADGSARLTNGIMMEVGASSTKIPLRDVSKLLQCHEGTLRCRLSKMKGKYQAMKKNLNRKGIREKINLFLEETFIIPTPKTSETEPKKKHVPCKTCTDMLEANEDLKVEMKTKLVKMKELYMGRIEELENQLKRSKQLRKKEKQNLQKLQTKLQELDAVTPRKAARKIKSLRNSVMKWKREFKNTNTECKHLQKMRSKHLCQIKNMRRKCYRLLQRLNMDVRKIRPKMLNEVPDNYMELINENEDLLSQLDQATGTVDTMDGRQYNSSIREVSYYLQEQGIAEHRIGDVVKTVLETITSRQVGPLPSRATQGRLAAEMKDISRNHVREHLEGEKDLTLKYDGTTKGRQGHIAEVELSTGKQTFMVGMKQQPGGQASDYVKSITLSVNQIQESALQDCANTMTDRCATNLAVDSQLEIIAGKKLNSYRCAMHPLDSMAKKADTVLKNIDKEIEPPQGTCTKPLERSEDSCSARTLLRATDKLFHNAASGDNIALKTYLKDNGYQSNLERWVGNRFNIMFRNAAILFGIGDGILEFFTKVSPPQNDLQRAFINAWANSSKMHLRCLGIIHCLLSGPWMGVIEASDSILELNAIFSKVISSLKEWEKDPMTMFHGQTAFGSPISDNDQYWQRLKTFPESEKQDVERILVLLVKGMTEVLERQLQSQLPQGEFWEPSEQLQKESESCETTNISGERNFAHLDSRLHRSPNTSISKLEGKVMFHANKTRKWLELMPQESKRITIQNAVRNASKVRQEDKVNSIEYIAEVRNRIKDKQKKRTEKDAKERDRIEDIFENVIQYGIVTANTLDRISELSKTRACTILRKQISFRNKILGQKMEEVAVSKCTREELQEVLMKFPADLEHTGHFVPIITNPHIMLGKQVKHRWEEEGVDMWFTGAVVAIEDNKLKLSYDNNSEQLCMTLAEFLTDLYLEDLVML